MQDTYQAKTTSTLMIFSQLLRGQCTWWNRGSLSFLWRQDNPRPWPAVLPISPPPQLSLQLHLNGIKQELLKHCQHFSTQAGAHVYLLSTVGWCQYGQITTHSSKTKLYDRLLSYLNTEFVANEETVGSTPKHRALWAKKLPYHTLSGLLV